MKRLIEYFHLNKLGGLELFFAFFPILSQYNFGLVYFAIIALLIMDYVAISRGYKPLRFKPIAYFLAFFVIHEIPVVLGFGGNIFGAAQNLLSLASVLFIVPALRWEKLVGSVYLVGIISMVGLLYHFLLLVSGNMGDIHPLTLPFLPEFSEESRAMEIIQRPTSFYWEPSSYITFMLVPMFFSMLERKYVLTFVIVFFNLLSGSTNGIALSFAMLGFYILTQDTKLLSKTLVVVAGIGMAYFLMTSELFDVGVEKMENTEASSNQRLHNGPALIQAMPIEHLITGFPAGDVTDYYNRNANIKQSSIMPLGTGNVFVSDFWRIFAKFGIVGLVLYLNIYLWFIRKVKYLRPYVLTLCVAMISQSVFLGSTSAFQLTVILTYVLSWHPNLLTKKKHYTGVGNLR